MDKTQAKAQPQDPVAARLGQFVSLGGLLLGAVLIAASLLRG